MINEAHHKRLIVLTHAAEQAARNPQAYLQRVRFNERLKAWTRDQVRDLSHNPSVGDMFWTACQILAKSFDPAERTMAARTVLNITDTHWRLCQKPLSPPAVRADLH